MKHPLRFTFLTSLLFLAMSFRPIPSDPAVPELRPPAQISGKSMFPEIAALQSPLPPRRPEQPLVTPRALEAALSGERQRFTLLPPSDPEDQRRFLHDLPYGSALAVAAERHELDGLLLAAVVQTESRFLSTAVSPKGAVGLMQVLPSTAEAYGEVDLFDPNANLDVGCRYLVWLLREYDGDLEMALAAYNAGPGTVERYGGVPPYRETREYVKKVLALYKEHHRRVVDPAEEVRAGA